MGLARSTFYDKSAPPLGEGELVTRIGAICDEFECYGYRRVGAALLHQGIVVNGKKLRRLMREHDLQPKRRRRYMVTTDSNHAGLAEMGEEALDEKRRNALGFGLVEGRGAGSGTGKSAGRR